MNELMWPAQLFLGLAVYLAVAAAFFGLQARRHGATADQDIMNGRAVASMFWPVCLPAWLLGVMCAWVYALASGDWS